jgi:mannose-6-phosphate isomerase-like protein (cupin superfamily)
MYMKEVAFMSGEIKQIAERMRAVRIDSAYTYQEAAKLLEIPPEEYLLYESGEIDIPISILLKISAVFNIELTALLTGSDPKLQTYSLVRKGQGLEVNRRQAYNYKHLAYNFVNKQAEPFLVTVEPIADDNPIPLSSHNNQEFNYVIEGSLMLVLNDHVLTLNEGDSLYFDANQPHGMKALNNQPVKFLAIIID